MSRCFIVHRNGHSRTYLPLHKTFVSKSKPSAIVRIKAGTTFDQFNLFNFEDISNGMNITDWLYLRYNNFIVNAGTKTGQKIDTHKHSRSEF